MLNFANNNILHFKKTLSVFFALLCITTYSNGKGRQFVTLSKDSLSIFPHYFLDGWKFSGIDDSSMALPLYDDSKWKTVESDLIQHDKIGKYFKGIGWFRLHLKVDSTVADGLVAMTMTHFGASEIYLDGKRIKTYGEIKGPDSSVYYDPQELPFIIMIPDTSEHVLAVRYANYNAERNYSIYKNAFAGFKIMMGDTNLYIRMKDLRSTVLSFVIMLLGGIFFALCLIHFFMYLYHKSARSNLYFSILMFSLALCFVIGFISYASHSPVLEMWSLFMLPPLFIISCISLSGFINELFSKGKLRFRIIAAIGIIAFIFSFFTNDFSVFMVIALVISVSFEAVVSVVFEIIKRTKGALIIGAGILFFALFILTTFAVAIIQQSNLDLNDSTVGGRIFILLLGVAILSIPISMSVYLAWKFSSVNKNLEVQLEQVQVLSQKTIEQEHEKQRMLENRKEELEKEVWDRTAELRVEKKKSDDLLLNILPAEVAEELKEKGRTNAKTYSMVTVMFADFKDFTDVSEKISAELLVAEIDHCFSAFDNIIHKFRVEKIKTIGDAYICAAGLPVLNFTHAEDMVSAALEIRTFVLNRKKEKESKGEIPFELRIGIHTGPVVAGIVGMKKFAYDIWGDTVNLAARMESSGEAGKVNISGVTYQLVKDKFNCEHRGKIQAKNKGEVDMYFAEGK